MLLPQVASKHILRRPTRGNECSLQGFPKGHLLGAATVTSGDTLFRILRGYYLALSSPAPGGVPVPPLWPRGLRQAQPTRNPGSHPRTPTRRLSPPQAQGAGTRPLMRTTGPLGRRAPTSRAPRVGSPCAPRPPYLSGSEWPRRKRGKRGTPSARPPWLEAGGGGPEEHSWLENARGGSWGGAGKEEERQEEETAATAGPAQSRRAPGGRGERA